MIGMTGNVNALTDVGYASKIKEEFIEEAVLSSEKTEELA